MIVNKLPMEDAFIIHLHKREDDRGYFGRLWCQEEFGKMGLDTNIVQINNSMNRKKGTLRGLHFQGPPKTETKIVRCIRGVIWDVIVDIRKDSKTYGEWFGEELTAENRKMMYVPKGFAHGFISLTNDSEIIYLVTEFYSPEYENALRWDDPFHGIEWPMQPQVISEKDNNIPNWQDNFAISEDRI
jgi:dTDP-4-dehydrorhamnose 3,5-epimerase